MKTLVISNMYPNKEFPTYGVFVRSTTESIEKYSKISKIVMNKKVSKLGKGLEYLVFYIRIIFFYLFDNSSLIYIHYPSHVAFLINKLSLIRKRNIITNVHGSDVVAKQGIEYKMRKQTEQLLQNSIKVVVPSSYFKTYLLTNYKGLSSSNIYCYPSGGVNSLIFNHEHLSKNEFIRHSSSITKNTYSYISRVDEGKGWDTYIHAISILKTDFPNIFQTLHFKIIGSGSKSNSLNDLLNENGLRDEIEWINSLPQKELAEEMKNSKFVIFPSELQESLGLVGLESMACGTPLITSGVAGISSYFVNEVNGIGFASGNASDLAKSIILSTEITDEEYDNMCTSAIETAKKYLDINVEKVLVDIIKR